MRGTSRTRTTWRCDECWEIQGENKERDYRDGSELIAGYSALLLKSQFVRFRSGFECVR